MNLRRILILAGVLLILFLGMYSWNQRTHALDDIAAAVGLEVGGAVLGSVRSVQDVTANFWDRYFALVDVREENLRLKARVDELESRLLASGEDLAELRRLRELVQLPVDVSWRPLGARVLAGRLGPNAVLDSITISRGYATGGRPGTPLVTHLGLVGRVLKASPHASTALLITDPGSRVAVFGQESRAPGILMGKGMGRELEVNFVQRDAGVKNGEVLVTSGLDGKYPKGLPVARVVSVAPSDYTQFMAVSAVPLVDLQHLEEVLLLEPSGLAPPPEEPEGPPPVFVGPPEPEGLPGRPLRAQAPRASGQGAAPAASPLSRITTPTKKEAAASKNRVLNSKIPLRTIHKTAKAINIPPVAVFLLLLSLSSICTNKDRLPCIHNKNPRSRGRSSSSRWWGYCSSVPRSSRRRSWSGSADRSTG
uniref:rod shape-determining protein MreC n=1 Tax=uncultured Desulfovibrio sp. TaxID=167968 RepID=UPI0026120DE6